MNEYITPKTFYRLHLWDADNKHTVEEFDNPTSLRDWLELQTYKGKVKRYRITLVHEFFVEEKEV